MPRGTSAVVEMKICGIERAKIPSERVGRDIDHTFLCNAYGRFARVNSRRDGYRRNLDEQALEVKHPDISASLDDDLTKIGCGNVEKLRVPEPGSVR